MPGKGRTPRDGPGTEPDEAAADGAGPRESLDLVEEEAEHAVTSLRRLFAERRLSVATMDRPLRVATAGAAAGLIGTVLLMALRNVGGGSVYLGLSSGTVTSISTPIFIAVIVLISIGFGYVFVAGSLTASWIAIPALGGLLFLVALYTGAFGGLIGGLGLFSLFPAWARWSGRAVLIAIALLTVFSHRIDRSRSREPRARILLVASYACLFGGYFFIIHEASPTIGSLNLYGLLVDSILGSLVFLMFPILQVAAVDFGEWGQLTGERLTSAITRQRDRRLWIVGVVTTAAMAGYGYWQLRAGRGWLSPKLALGALRDLLILGAGLALILGAFYLLRLNQRRWPRNLSFASIVAACALTAVVFPVFVEYVSGGLSHLRPGPQVSASGEYLPGADVVSVHASTGPTGYSLLIPRGWVTHQTSSIVTVSNYDGKGGYERATTALFPVIDISLAAHALGVTTGAMQTLGPWQGASISGAGIQGYLWTTPVNSDTSPGTYLLYETVHGAGFPLTKAQPTLFAIANSFRGSGQPPAPLPPPAEQAQTAQSVVNYQFSLEVGLGIGLAAILVAVGLVGKRWRPQFVGTGLILGFISVFSILFFANELGSYLFGSRVHLPYLGAFGLLFAAGLIGLITVVAVRLRGRDRSWAGRRILAGVIGLEAALAVLQAMSWLYDRALKASRVSIWAAVILLIAIAWDVTMSGESMTNHGTNHLPRASRVLGFFGYIILLAGTVLFYSAEKVIATGKAAEAYFEPESVTQNALFRVALPVLILAFLLRLSRGPHPPDSAGTLAESAPTGSPGAPMPEGTDSEGHPVHHHIGGSA